MTDRTDPPRSAGLPEHELLYRQIVEGSPLAVALLTNEPDSRVLFASPRIEEISGFSPAELLEQPGLWARRFHPDEAPSLSAKWQAAIRDEERMISEYRFLHREGEWRWFRETSAPVRDAEGAVLYRQSFTEDITSERFAEAQAERSEARYRALVERLPVIVYVDSDEIEPQSLYVSPNSREILGYLPRDYLADPELWFHSMHPDDLPRVRQAWADAVRTREPFHAEYRDLTPDGRVVWVRDDSLLVHDDDGRPLFWQGVLLDITAERETEVMLDRSEARYRALIEHLPVVVYLDAYGPSEASRYVSPNVADVLGYPAEAFVRDTHLWQELVHRDDLDRAEAAWRHGWSTGTGWSVEYRYVHPAGHDVSVRDEARMVIDPATGELTWQGVIVDLTGTKRAEADLRRSEQRYRALVEQVPAVVYEMGLDDERRTMFVSPHVEEILGYPREEWLDQPDIWVELLHPEDREKELAAHDRHNESGEPWQREYRLIASDGQVVWVRDHAELVTEGESSRWLGVMFDVSAQREAQELLRLANEELEMRVLTRTAELEDANEMMALEIGERRRIEHQLHDAQDRFRALVEHIPGVVYSWRVPKPEDTARRAVDTYTSPQIEDLLGFTVTEWGSDGRFWETRVHPHDRERVMAATERSRRDGVPFSEEFRYFARDGHIVWVLELATLLRRDEQGRPASFQGVMLDVTERRRAQEQAEAAEERFKLLAERGPIVVYEYALEHAIPPIWRLRYLTPSASDLLGMPVTFLEGSLEERLAGVHPDDAGRMADAVREIEATGGPWNHIFRTIAADGRIVWLLDRGGATERDEQGRPVLVQGVLIDVTDQAEVHAALEASESMLRSIVISMPAVPWIEVEDPRGGRPRFRFVGPQVESIYGYSPDELLADPDSFFQLVHPDDRARLRAADAESLRTGRLWDELYRMIHRDGSVHWILGRGRRVVEDGRHVWHGVGVDVTDYVETGWVTSEPIGTAEEHPG